MRFHYTLTGAIEVPEGSRLNPTNTGIVLPDGQLLRMWEGWFFDDGETEIPVSFETLQQLGIIFDGDVTHFEEVEETSPFWPPAP